MLPSQAARNDSCPSKHQALIPSLTGLLVFCLALVTITLNAGCGGAGTSRQPPRQPTSVSVAVTPTAASIFLGATQQFTATVTGGANTSVNWSVTVGTITSGGVYTAPADLPNPAKIAITATSQADASKSASVAVTVMSDIVLSLSTNPANARSVATGKALPFAAAITSAGNPDKAVTWTVNGILGGNGTVGTVDATGLYTAPATVPSPFTVRVAATSVADSSKSASSAIIVAGTIASVSQFISAATGGTITLPDGSSVTIPPGALSADQTVTLSELSLLPQQPPNQLVIGIGPALSLKLSAANPVAALRPKFHQRNRGASQTQILPSDVQFTIVMGPNAASTLLTSAPMADLQFVSGDRSFGFASGTFDSTNQVGNVGLDPSFLSEGQQIDVSMANFDSTRPTVVLPIKLYWDGHQFQKIPIIPAFVCPLPDSIIPANGKILVLVHGMWSTVEQAFRKTSEIQAAGGYGLVTGFDYDWTLRIQDPSNPTKTSSSSLAAFLDSLALCSAVKQIDIEAHSEGVAVTLATGGQVNSTTSQILGNIVSLAGPIRGTPLANAPKDFSSVALNAGPGGVVIAGFGVGLFAFLNGLPPLEDLTSTGDPLAPARQKFAASLPKIRFIAVGGDTPIKLDPTLDATIKTIFAGHPYDTVIPLDSALGYESGIKVYPLSPFHDHHWARDDNDQAALITDPAVISAVGKQVRAPASPSLQISSTNCQLGSLACSDFPGTNFALGGSGYTPSGSILRYEQVATGQVTSVSPTIPSDSNGSISNWQDATACADPPTTKVFFTQDAATGLASNAITESLTSASGVSVVLTPQEPTLRSGSTQAFTAALPSCASSVVWAVNGVPQGNSTIGTINASGVYTAPIPLPPSNAVDISVSATIGNATATGSTTVNLLNPIPTLSSVSPTLIGLGPFALTLSGSNFAPGAMVTFGSAQLTANFVSSTQLTASGTATTSQANSSVAVSVTNPFPDSPISNPLNVSVVNTTGGGSGSTAILGNKAYVPITSLGIVAVLNVDSTTSTGALITSIPMPPGYQPSATAANPITKKVFVVSFNSSDIQLIDAAKDIWITSYTAPVNQFAVFSGGNCVICGALVDFLINHVILDTAQGSLLFDPTTGQFGSFLPTIAAENFAFNSNSRIALLPTYNQLGFTGLQALNVDTGAVSQYSASVGSAPDSAAVDLMTNLAVIPDEFTDNQYLINMKDATFSAATFSAPQTVFQVPVSSLSSCNEWTEVSIEIGTHLLFLANEFGGSSGGSFRACAAVETMPAAPVTGAPPMPAAFHWGPVPNTPDGFPWLNSFDPHGIAVFTSVLNGKAYGFLVNRDQTWVARVDLDGVRNAQPIPGSVDGRVDLAQFVTFLRTQ